MISLIIFDCDGVLLETESVANQCEVEALQKLGFPIVLEEYIDLALGKRSREVEILLKEKYQIDLPPGFWKEMSDKQNSLFERHLTAVEGVSQAIESIPLPRCIASSSGLERLHYTLNIARLLPFFEGRIYSAESVKRGKPFPDLFLYAAKQMAADPNQCLVIEDSLAGIEGGLSAGMTVIAFGGGKHITPRMKNRLQESKAHFFFDRMSDLPNLLNRFI